MRVGASESVAQQNCWKEGGEHGHGKGSVDTGPISEFVFTQHTGSVEPAHRVEPVPWNDARWAAPLSTTWSEAEGGDGPLSRLSIL